ncbi:glucose-6-phosphate dehydrogenase [Pseudomonadota bacterium]
MELFKIQKPFIFTIFGASGDLAKLKIFPAMYRLAEQHRLPSEYYIVGYARTDKSQDDFRKEFSASVKKDVGKDLNPKLLKDLIKHVFYFTGQYDQKKSFTEYRKYLKDLSGKTTYPHITYFSVPPVAFRPILKNLSETRKTKKEDIRLVIEKPFGEDSESAEQLFHFISQHFKKEQIYLLDHYLGKSAVQSILFLRHANRILNLLLRGSQIANIQITAAEKVGVEDRVSYFDQVGIIKDMVQSHLLQVLSLITMSIPIQDSAASLQREKNSIISALKFQDADCCVSLGQYESYKKLRDVPQNSKTETFAAIKLFIDQQYWYKVPIYIRTGKKLDGKHTFIAIEFKKYDFQKKEEEPNVLVIELYPEEKVTIKLLNKNYFGASNYQAITTSRSIACSGDDCLPEHGLLLLEVIRGRKLNFLSFPEILASWKIADEIQAHIKKRKVKVEKYKDNSPGPASQHALPEKDGFKWHCC